MPPVLNLPNLIVSRRPSPSGGGLPQHQAVGQVKDRSSLYDPSVVTLDLTNLASCLQSLSIDEIYPVLSTTTTKVNTEVKQKSTSMYLLVVRLFFAHFFKSFADPKVLKSWVLGLIRPDIFGVFVQLKLSFYYPYLVNRLPEFRKPEFYCRFCLSFGENLSFCRTWVLVQTHKKAWLPPYLLSASIHLRTTMIESVLKNHMA